MSWTPRARSRSTGIRASTKKLDVSLSRNAEAATCTSTTSQRERGRRGHRSKTARGRKRAFEPDGGGLVHALPRGSEGRSGAGSTSSLVPQRRNEDEDDRYGSPRAAEDREIVLAAKPTASGSAEVRTPTAARWSIFFADSADGRWASFVDFWKDRAPGSRGRRAYYVAQDATRARSAPPLATRPERRS